MYKLLAVLSLATASNNVFAATDTQLAQCVDRAKSAALVFQNEIVGDGSFSKADLDSKSENSDQNYVYVFTSVNSSGSRIRSTSVITDPFCNIQSTSRAD